MTKRGDLVRRLHNKTVICEDCLLLDEALRKEHERGERLLGWLRQCKVNAAGNATDAALLKGLPLDQIPGYVGARIARLSERISEKGDKT